MIRGSRPDNIQFCFIASMIKIFSCKNKLAEAELVATEFISIKIALDVLYTPLKLRLTLVAKIVNDPDLSKNLFTGTN